MFRDAFLKAHPRLTLAGLEAAQAYNFQRYHYQGIGRYEPAQAYQRGLADLRVLSHLIGEAGFLFGASPTSTDAGVYGFIANIYYYDIETPASVLVGFAPNRYPASPIRCDKTRRSASSRWYACAGS